MDPTGVVWLADETLAIVEHLDEVAESRGDDPEDVVHVIGLLRQIRGAVSAAIATQERLLTTLLPAGQSLQVPGVAQVSVSSNPKKKSHGARLARRLAARVADTAVDRETGEMVPPAVLCERTADEMVAVFGLDTASATIRTGEVKKRGMKMGDFVSYEDGDPKVQWLDGS